jgi:addiction module RelE/StbE family toxin
MKLIWTRKALQSRRQVVEHIATSSIGAADSLNKKLGEKASALLAHPYLGRPGRIPGTRELVVHAQYIIVYELVGQTVRVLYILHTSRQWPPKRQT